MMRVLYILITVSATILLSGGCRKEPVTVPEQESLPFSGVKNGFPASDEKVAAIFVAQFSEFVTYGGRGRFLQASFFDPPIKISTMTGWTSGQIAVIANGNVAVGQIGFNGQLIPLLRQSDFAYYSLMDKNVEMWPTTSEWAIGGNKSFPSESVSLRRGCPEITGSTTFSVKLGHSLTLEHRNLFLNYDSVFVRTYPYGDTLMVWSPEDSVAVIPAAVLFAANYQTPAILIEAINYSHKVSAGRIYLFVNAIRIERKINVLPP